MSDQEMTEDFLGLNDPDQALADQTPGLVVPARAGGHELRALDAMRRMEGMSPEAVEQVVNHWRVVFVDENDAFEKWDGRGPIELRPAEVWRVRMGWPKGCEPTPADAEQWVAHRRALLMDLWSPRLAWARAQDELAAAGTADPG
jgi:hypothetical protein